MIWLNYCQTIADRSRLPISSVICSKTCQAIDMMRSSRSWHVKHHEPIARLRRPIFDFSGGSASPERFEIWRGNQKYRHFKCVLLYSESKSNTSQVLSKKSRSQASRDYHKWCSQKWHFLGQVHLYQLWEPTAFKHSSYGEFWKKDRILEPFGWWPKENDWKNDRRI